MIAIPQLYKHQKTALGGVFSAYLKDKKKVLLQLPTGGGKTVVFNHFASRVVREKGYRVLIIAHREELILQAARKLIKRGHQYDIGIIKNGYKADYSKKIQVASIQSLINRPFPKNVDLVIIDEAHRSAAPSYRTIIDHYSNSYILGVTATPTRLDGKGLGEIYEEIVTGPSIKWMEENGFLCPAKIYSFPVDKKALKKIPKSGKDYSQKHLSKFVNQTGKTANLVETWLKYAKGLKTIVFAVDVEHSKRICAQYQAAGIKAIHIDGKTPNTKKNPERRRILQAFEKGIYAVLVNVGIAIEGLDIPSIQCVQHARPSKSLVFWLQANGRAARTFAGKTNYILLDHAGMIDEHGLPNKERIWTLEGEKSKRQPQLYEVHENGKQIGVMHERDIPEQSSDLVLVPLGDHRAYTDQLMENFITFVKKQGKPKRYALRMFENRIETLFGRVPNLNEIKTYYEMSGMTGNFKGWAHYTMNEYYNKPKDQWYSRKQYSKRNY